MAQLYNVFTTTFQILIGQNKNSLNYLNVSKDKLFLFLYAFFLPSLFLH